jgi:hypothetical protein
MATYGAEFPHQITTKLLHQSCGARKDSYVNWVAWLMLKDFKLSIRGQRNVNTALNNLPTFYSLDESLTFGWSPSNIIRVVDVLQTSYDYLAIMFALADTFHNTYAAQVLHHIAVAKAGEGDVTPHITQWRDHVSSSNGVFAAHDFGLMVENYLRLDPHSVALGSKLTSERVLTEPRQIAEALLALARVTSGKDKQVTLIGGNIIGWFAAISEWLFDLPIALFSCNGDQVLDSTHDQEPQVILVFHQHPDIQVHPGRWRPSEAMEKPKNHNHAYSDHLHFVPFGGRVSWQSLLPIVFGQSFFRLNHYEAKTFHTAIGSVARGFQGLVEGEDNLDVISCQNRSDPASFGPGLIQTLTSWLPELRHGQGRMERQLKLSFKEAPQIYFESMKKLHDICHCQLCSDSTTPPAYGFCLVVLVETIVALGLALSKLIVASQVYPTREGLQNFYKSQLEKRLEAKHVDVHDLRHFAIIYGNEWNASDSRRLQNCVAIFSGRRPETDVPEGLVALAHEGICAYMMRLQPSKKTADGAIRIVTGAINIWSKIYTRASEALVKDSDESWMWEEIKFEHLKKPLYLK